MLHVSREIAGKLLLARIAAIARSFRAEQLFAAPRASCYLSISKEARLTNSNELATEDWFIDWLNNWSTDRLIDWLLINLSPLDTWIWRALEFGKKWSEGECRRRVWEMVRDLFWACSTSISAVTRRWTSTGQEVFAWNSPNQLEPPCFQPLRFISSFLISLLTPPDSFQPTNFSLAPDMKAFFSRYPPNC